MFEATTNVLSKSMGCFCGKEAITIEGRRYFVRSRLGEGGFSFVDLIEDARTHRLYALKRIPCHSKEDEKLALAEANYMKKLDHPNLISCDGVDVAQIAGKGSITSEVRIIMPFCKNGTVQDTIDRKEVLEERCIVDIFLGLCLGLAAMHGSSPPLAHRDIKPANILLADNGMPLIMDLGSVADARVQVTSSAQAQTVQDVAAERCSMPFRAPELFHVERNATITESTDIWSLGCTLYAMLYLKSPFDDVYQRGDSVALASTSGNIKFPQQHRYSQALVELAKSMLVVEPSARPTIAIVLSHVNSMMNQVTITV